MEHEPPMNATGTLSSARPPGHGDAGRPARERVAPPDSRLDAALSSTAFALPGSRIADREQDVRDVAEALLAIGSETSLDEVLQQTVDTAARLVAARWAALGVLDRTGSHLERFITVGIDDETRARIGDLPGDHGVLRVLLRDGRPLRLADVTKSPDFTGFPSGHPPMRSFLGVPIFVRDVVYGDLYLADKAAGEFTEVDEEIVTLLAAQTALTIERVRIHEAVVDWVRQLEVLDELTLGVLEERDVSRLLDVVARRLRELIGARRVLVSVPDPSGGYRVVATAGEGAADLIGYSVPSESKSTRVLARGRSERIDSLLEDLEVDQASARRVGGLAALFIPVAFREQAIGVISAFNKDGPDPRFTDDDLRLAEAFSSRAALAIHLSRRVARDTFDAILDAQEAERSRLARELHDETGSALSGVLLGLTAIDQAATLLEARQASAALRETARTTLEHVARMAFELRPPTLDEFGLIPALKDLSRGLQCSGGPKVELNLIPRNAERLPPKVETALFRITQEALTNVVKHADAKTVQITLARQEQSVVLTVDDNGRGFSQAQARGDHFGLVGMRERTASVDGTLDITSKPGAGTRLTVKIPLL
jgi:signal transduction histidine kinase